MAKLVLTDLASLQNETTAIQTINANYAKIVEAIEQTFSRDGTTPNQLEASLDVNGQRILNIPAPSTASEPARLADIQEAAFPTIVIPSLTANDDKIMSNSGGVLVWVVPGSLPGIGDMRAVNNLAEVNSSLARGNLGLGTAALKNTGVLGNTIPLLDGSNTWSADQIFSGLLTASGGLNLVGTIEPRNQTTPSSLSIDSIGYRGAPILGQDAAYTFVLLDSGKTILHTSAGAHTWTIPTNAAVNFPNGTAIVLLNTGSGAVTISRSAGVALRIGGSSVDADRTLGQHGIATLFKADVNSWYITGSGVS